MRDLERKYGAREPRGEPPDPAAAALLGTEDAIDAAQEARWHTTGRQPTAPLHRAAYGLRIEQAQWEGWSEQSLDAYLRAFAAQLVAMDIALVQRAIPEGDGLERRWAVDLRRFEARPWGISTRLDQPAYSGENPDADWRLRGRWRRFRAWLDGR
jgi:hypothetical protein